jgi:hypothetical protein
MPKTPQVLTTRELDTLATMIHSSGNHMSNARDNTGNLVWGWREVGDAYTDMVNGFYDIQLRAPGFFTRPLTNL